MSNELEEVMDWIRQLVTGRRDAIIPELARSNSRGYAVRSYDDPSRVRLYFVDNLPGGSDRLHRIAFYQVYRPLLEEKFGRARVSRGAAPVRVAGRSRAISYLEVTVD